MHEVDIHLLVRLHHLVHAEAQSRQPNIRCRAGHVSGDIFDWAEYVTCHNDNHEFSVTEVLDLFDLPGGSRHPATAVLLQRTKMLTR